jgi:hypothetical protein
MITEHRARHAPLPSSFPLMPDIFKVARVVLQ